MDHKFLIDRLKKGDNSVLKTFYENHGRYCVQKLVAENQCSLEDAEDIFIEAIMELREKLITGKTTEISNPRAYLYKTCHNMFLVRLKLDQRKRKKLSEIERFYYGSRYQVDQTDAYDPRLLEITIIAWNTLSEKCKDILNYFYIEKLVMSEIAKLMGLSNANVAKSTKSRCYKNFVTKAFEIKDSGNIKLSK